MHYQAVLLTVKFCNQQVAYMSQISTELTLTLSASIEEVTRAEGIIMKLIKTRTEIIKMEALSFIWSCENVQANHQLQLLAISKKGLFQN